MTCPAYELDLPLLTAAAEIRRERLLASALGGLLPGEVVADLFCGAGGWGEGLKLVGGEVGYAVNHSPDAIATHETNNPGCRHHMGDAWKARPRDVIADALAKGGTLGLLLASAACTTHSRAAGGAPISKRVHMLGWCIARWMEELSPRIVLIENVPEWEGWGPLIPRLDEHGKPMRDERGRALMKQDPARKGQHFRRWWRYCERLGYVMEKRVLDAPDYGEASRRKRLFIIARRDGAPIVWPEITNGQRRDQALLQDDVQQRDRRKQGSRSQASVGDGDCQRAVVAGWSAAVRALGIDHHDHARGDNGDCGGTGLAKSRALNPYRTAADIIDWSDLGRSIFDRKGAGLKPKTQARIAEGIRRYVIRDAHPFVVRVTHGEGSWKVSPIDAAMPTQTTRQDLTLCSPVLGARSGTCTGGSPRTETSFASTCTVGITRDTSTPAADSRNSLSGPARNSCSEHGRPTRSGRGDFSSTTASTNGPGSGNPASTAPSFATNRPSLVPNSFEKRTQLLIASGLVCGITPTWMRKKSTAATQAIASSLLGGDDADLRKAGSSCLNELEASPIAIHAHHGGGQSTRVDDSLPSITAGGVHANLATPLMMNNTTHHTGGRVDDSAPTMTTGGQCGLVAPLTTDYYGNATTAHRGDASLGTVTTRDRHGLVGVITRVMGVLNLSASGAQRALQTAAWLKKHLGNDVSIEAETGLAYILIGGIRRYFIDILFRMLKVLELAAAMGFPAAYEWPRTSKGTINQRKAVRMIGNAVSVRTARALIAAVLPRLSGDARRAVVA